MHMGIRHHERKPAETKDKNNVKNSEIKIMRNISMHTHTNTQTHTLRKKVLILQLKAHRYKKGSDSTVTNEKNVVLKLKNSMDGLKSRLYTTREFVLWGHIRQREGKYKRKVKSSVWSSECLKIIYLIQVLDVGKSKNGAHKEFEGISRHGKNTPLNGFKISNWIYPLHKKSPHSLKPVSP